MIISFAVISPISPCSCGKFYFVPVYSLFLVIIENQIIIFNNIKYIPVKFRIFV